MEAKHVICMQIKAFYIFLKHESHILGSMNELIENIHDDKESLIFETQAFQMTIPISFSSKIGPT